jgi:hypothetical protein
MAEQANDLEQSRNKLAWDNFYKSNQLAQSTIEQHNASMMTHGLNMLPQFKELVRSIADPVQRTQMTDHLGKVVDSYAPGLSKVLKLMNTKPNQILGLDMLLAHPIYGPAFQELAATNSYENLADNPNVIKLVELVGRDTIPLIYSRFTNEEKTLAASGKMTQRQFEKAFDVAVADESFGPVKPLNVAFAKSTLHTEYGEDVMLGMGIRTDASMRKQANKAKPEGEVDLQKQLRNEKITEAQSVVSDTTGKYSAEHVKKAKDELQVFAGLEQKQSNVGINPNNRVEQRLRDLTGKNITTNDILDMPAGPEKTKLIEKLHQASVQQDEYVTKARNEGLLGMPVDMSKVDMYDRRTLQKGTISKLSVPMSEREKRTNPNLVELEPKFLGGLSKLLIAKDQGNKEMFDLADQAFPAKDAQGLAGQWAKWKALELGGLAAIAVTDDKANDSLVAYHDTFTAWAGKDARALGDEVGTMTDADRLVWKDTFPKPTDTPSIRKQKRAIFNRMIDLIYDVNVRVATGEQPEAVFVDKAFVSKKAGIFGSARQVVAESQGKGLSPREKLEQQMKAE